MKIKLELFGATRDLNSKEFIEFNIEEKSSIKELRKKIINYVDDKFKGNENFKKLIQNSVFCSDKDEIIYENHKINQNQIVGIIPPIGGG